MCGLVGGRYVTGVGLMRLESQIIFNYLSLSLFFCLVPVGQDIKSQLLLQYHAYLLSCCHAYHQDDNGFQLTRTVRPNQLFYNLPWT